MTFTKPPTRDRDAIELMYRQGLVSIEHICKHYDVKRTALMNHARKCNWVRPLDMDDLEDDAHAVADSKSEIYVPPPTIHEGATYPRDIEHSLFSPDDIKKATLLTAVTVVTEHRQDIKRLRNVTTAYVDTLQELVSPDLWPIDETGNKVYPNLHLMGKDGPADFLDKVTKSLARLVQLERTAYGLRNDQNPRDEDEGDRTANDQVNELFAKLNEMAAEKAKN